MTCSHPAPSPCYFSYPPPPPYVPPPPPPPQLEECHVEAHIIDVHSFVTLSQKFRNTANVASTELTYNFTVLAGAAICGFKMIRASRKEVIGVIKDKEQALQEINTAKAEGHAFALGEELTKDVGNINAGEAVTVEISYINPLIDDDSQYRNNNGLFPQLRFTLPLAYLQRAGQAPSGKILSGVHPTNVPFTMELSIEQSSPIIDYRTPGYTPAATFGRDGVPEEHRDHFLHLSFPSSTSSADIIVVITAEELGFSRAFIEHHPSHDPPSTALSFTFVPGDDFYEVESSTEMEYIVLVDESNSMAGLKLEMTRKALEFLLDQLPSSGSYFNIFEYGESVRQPGFSLVSKLKDDVEVGRAKNYIASMKADLGANKQTSQALKHVFDSLPATLTRPVSIFLVTDGAAWDVKDCMSITQQSIASKSTETNFMRVFTLGLGDGASTETCDGIARAGGGMATYIATAEQSFLGKCLRLVLGARTPPITNIKISWEDESLPPDSPPPETFAAPSTHSQQPQRISTPSKKKKTGSAMVSARAEPYVRYTSRTATGALLRAQQAPTKLPFLNGTRLSVFALVPRNRVTTNTLKVEFTIPSRPGNNRFCLDPVDIEELSHSQGKTFLHTIAVKQIIAELEDKHAIAPASEALELQGEIAYYGKKYGLTSRFTSFLAVDNGRAVGLANDVFGATSVAPRRLTNSERQAVPSTPRSFSTRSPRSKAASSVRQDVVAGKDKLAEPDDRAIVFELSSLQSSDGGFGNNAAKVIELVSPYCPKRALRIVEEYPLVIRSAFLAGLWILLWGRIEATLLRKKVDVWIRKNVGPNVDVKVIQKKLYQTAN
ncbi:hypothetical protein H0H93_003590 [Arthromyces matolae]|nr:hypothetical protein H0H93_003590 [Arthromyces matolae]